jgi:hypothetical protein
MAQTADRTQVQVMEEQVTRFFHMLNSHCPVNTAPLLTPDVELHADERAVGQEAVNAFFLRLWEAYPCIAFRVENLIIGETGAAAEVTYTAGPGGQGARCLIFQFRGGLIRRVRCY